MLKSRLNQIMKAQKISGKEISLATEICESTISKFLSGNQEPKYSQIIQLAKAVHLPPDVFMSVISSEYDTAPPIINECCMIREIYRDASSNLHIVTLHSFKEFTMDLTDWIYDEAIYVSVILKGGTDSELVSLRAGEYRIIKGCDYKGVKMTVLNETIGIGYIIQDSPEDITKGLSRVIFEGLKTP